MFDRRSVPRLLSNVKGRKDRPDNASGRFNKTTRDAAWFGMQATLEGFLERIEQQKRP
jgi:hypothetical protein